MKWFTLVFIVEFIMVVSACSSNNSIPATSIPQSTLPPKLTLATKQTLTPEPTLLHKKGVPILHEPNENTGFPWYSYIPYEIDEKDEIYILLDAASGQIACDINDAENNSIGQMHSFFSSAREWKYVLLFPVIPRDCSRGDNWNYFFGKFDVWGSHLDSSTFLGDPESFNYRVDLKIVEMIKELKNQLLQDGYKVHEKVFLMGFSTGGNFANRFSLLHPEIVEVVGVGGLSGIISLPIDSYDERIYNWYNGIANFKVLTGYEFNNNEFEKIGHFIFWGELDETNHCPSTGVRCFNSNPVKSNEFACNYFKELGYEVNCQEYKGVGHEFTEEMYKDMFTFFESHKRKE